MSRNIVAIREVGVQTAAGVCETASASDELKRCDPGVERPLTFGIVTVPRC